VIAADTLTGIQDFRADEKALQILEQFRGRCGRRDNKGLLAIQTSQPAHPVYMKLISEAAVPEVHDLLEERKEFHFAPYSRIIQISVRDQHEERAGTMSGKLAEALSASLKDTSREIVTGPYQPVIDKIADMHIRCIRISLPKNRMLKENKDAIRHAINVFEKERKYDGHIVVNVDPA
jgi:primosomal protein N' (replication factor Y)